MRNFLTLMLFLAGGLAFYTLTAFLCERYSPLVVLGGILLAVTVWGLLS